jgi:hypothetical protein
VGVVYILGIGLFNMIDLEFQGIDFVFSGLKEGSSFALSSNKILASEVFLFIGFAKLDLSLLMFEVLSLVVLAILV